MTAKIESNFGREIMKNIKAYWIPFTITAKEGVPDLIGIKDGVTIFLELKCIKQNSINITPPQIATNFNIFKYGKNNYYIVQDTRSKVIKLYSGDKGRELKEQGFKCPCDLKLEPPIYWERLKDYLFLPPPLELRV